MKTKLYRMNLRRSYARVILQGKTGNKVIYEFTHGNPMNSVPAKCLISGEYEQELLEGSDIFKNGTISIERVVVSEDAETEKGKAHADKEPRDAGMLSEESITSAMDAINYVATNFDAIAKTALEAKRIAEKHGVMFPNLRVGKK